MRVKGKNWPQDQKYCASQNYSYCIYLHDLNFCMHRLDTNDSTPFTKDTISIIGYGIKYSGLSQFEDFTRTHSTQETIIYVYFY